MRFRLFWHPLPLKSFWAAYIYEGVLHLHLWRWSFVIG